GLENSRLVPPAPAPEASFQTRSGTNPTSLPEGSYLGVNWVPPTEVTLGSEPISLTLRVVPETQFMVFGSSTTSAAPASPWATKIDWPCAAALAKSGSRKPVK